MSNNGGQPGWREDTQRPGIQRYWVGGAWADDIAPRPSPEPIWRTSTAVALGVLMAAAVVYLFGQIL